MRLGEKWLPGAIRFSLGRSTTEEDIDFAVAALSQSVARLRHMSPLARSA
jgi:cysteine sulfinate desulfinase/cysteine desulfurase-like protein